MTVDMRKPEDHYLAGKVCVFANGINISTRCFYASEETGIALCCVDDLEKTPSAYLQDGLWVEKITGVIEVKPI